MPWDTADLRSRTDGVAGRLFAGIRHLAAVRAGLEHLHASVAAEALPPSDPGVLAVLRQHPIGPMLGLYNVTEDWHRFPYGRLVELGLEDSVDVLTGTTTLEDELWLAPYEARWIVSR
jgi:amylosucrase